MSLTLLLDTHILLRWLVESRKLSREQRRVLDEAWNRNEPVGIGAISLLEAATVLGAGGRVDTNVEKVFDQVDANPIFQIIPITTEIAREVAALGPHLRDPADRAIVATARVHRLKLLTSDQRILDSKLVPTIE